MRNLIRRFGVLSVLVTAVACGGGGGGSSPSASAPSSILSPKSGETAVLVGAGDIAQCGSRGTEATAVLLDTIGGVVFTTGDHAYQNGTAEQFEHCYHPTWGRHRSRTRPVPGNHDYEQAGGGPYYDYFGSRAGAAGLGYYSFDAGNWHIVALNSVIPAGEGSAQLMWLRDDLAETSSRCLAAIWHHPLFSSGPNPPQAEMRAAWRVLQEAGAEFVVNGHDHLYERFAPADEVGRPMANGIREFIVGTGGAPLYGFAAIHPASEARGSAWGVMKFTLRPDAYTWEFVPIAGESFRDTGTAACH